MQRVEDRPSASCVARSTQSKGQPLSMPGGSDPLQHLVGGRGGSALPSQVLAKWWWETPVQGTEVSPLSGGALTTGLWGGVGLPQALLFCCG